MPFLQLSLDIGTRDPEPYEDALFELGALSVTLLDAADDPVLEPAPGAMPLWPTIVVRAVFAADAEILKVADDESADMIILGQSGKRGFDRFITGRVAKHVEKHAKVPVLVAKQPLMCEEPFTKRDAWAAVSVTSAVVVLLFILGFILQRGTFLH